MSKLARIEGAHFVAVREGPGYGLYSAASSLLEVRLDLPVVLLDGDALQVEYTVRAADAAYRRGVEDVLEILRSRTSSFRELDELEKLIQQPPTPPKRMTSDSERS